METEIVMYTLFLAIGFGLGVVAAMTVLVQRLEKRIEAMNVTVTPPKVEISVSEELVARYLAAFDLVAIPKKLVIGAGENPTRH
ncbi:MAG TPA: hypothetical protein VNL74_14005 [Methylococcus sp.]|nr:hypothetical protein [Methylococcus sp.]